MLNSVSYTLTREPGTKSEIIFHPDASLLNFINSSHNSRIFRIQASNSKGKSFLLNLISYSLFGLELSSEDLIPTLRRSIESLTDESHQKIEFDLSFIDPEGFLLNSKFSQTQSQPIVTITENEITTEFNFEKFVKQYKLVYDIPEKPLERIYQVIKSLKVSNNELMLHFNPIDIILEGTLRKIDNQRNETCISPLKSWTKLYN